MKFSIDQSLLKTALQRVLSVVDKKTPNPVLSNILMVVDPQELTLTSTNMDIAILEKLPLHLVEKTGAIVAPAHMLNDIVTRLPNGCEIQFEVESNELGQPLSTFKLSTDKLNYTLSYLEKNLFPDIRPSEYPWHFQMSAGQLRDVLNRSRFSMAEEEVRHFLSGVYLFPLKNQEDAIERPELCAIATDGHRLAKITTPFATALPDFPGIILPAKTTDVLCRLLASQEENILLECDVSQTSLCVKFGSICLISKLVNGQYPDYTLALPKGDIRKVHVSKDGLVRAADRMAIVADPILRAIDAQISDNQLRFSVPGSKNGSGFEEISVVSEIDQIGTVFNADYLIEAARHIKGDMIELQVIDAESAIMLKGKDDGSALYVLMPIVS